jgi:hypothetical protein
MTMMGDDAYSETQRAVTDVLNARDEARRRGAHEMRNGNGGKWPQWVQTMLAVGAVIVSIVLAYATLDKRISLLEQKIDFIVNRVK